MASLGEAIHHCKDNQVTMGLQKSSYKVHGDVGPVSTWDGQWVEQTSRGLMRGLIPGAGSVHCHILLNISDLHGQQFPILDILISYSGGQTMGEKSAGMQAIFRTNKLR